MRRRPGRASGPVCSGARLDVAVDAGLACMTASGRPRLREAAAARQHAGSAAHPSAMEIADRRVATVHFTLR
ncbi:MAG TPA: hypothetical protein PK743_12220, partial [Luteimonas sp.]|nr:hypothetical protein [Luteimonas sp.]